MDLILKKLSTSLLLALLFSISQYAFSNEILPTVDCVIQPSKIVDISAPVAGVVVNVHKSTSHLIKAGELLAELNSSVEQAALELAKSRTDLTAEINLAKVNLEFDELKLKRLKRVSQLSPKNLVSLTDLDQSERDVQITYWRLKQIKQSQRVRFKELAQAKAQLETKKVYAPFDGVVAEQYKLEGEYVDGQPILKLVSLNPLHVDAVFPFEYYSRIKKGMSAQVFPETNQQQGYQALVDVIDPIGDVASGTFGVRFVLDNKNMTLPAGLKCYLQIEEIDNSDSETVRSSAEKLEAENFTFFEKNE